MEKFKISDIQEIFVADVERFHNLTQHHLNQLLTTPSQESLDEALRQCHSLKGLAATVHAHGLAALGADFELLLQRANAVSPADPAAATDIFHFILAHMQDWFVMNQFSAMDMLPQAWDIYQGLRALMDERWPGLLPQPDPSPDSQTQYIRLKDLQLAQLTPPPTPTPELDVRGVAPVATGAPLPVRLVPPALKREAAVASDKGQGAGVTNPEVVSPVTRHATPPTENPAPLPVAIAGRDVLQGAPIASDQGQVSGVTNPEVVSPVTRHAPPPADSASPSTINAQPSTNSAPPILRVAPPALKRLAKTPVSASDKGQGAGVTSPEVVSPVTRHVTPPAENAPPSTAAAEWRELVSQEVAGYLGELGSCLVALASGAGGLTDVVQWQQARRLFHTIKGTAATFKLDAVSAPAKAAEKGCVAILEALQKQSADLPQRARKAVERCVERAQVVAQALGLSFAAEAVREALRVAETAAANAAAAQVSTNDSQCSTDVNAGDKGQVAGATNPEVVSPVTRHAPPPTENDAQLSTNPPPASAVDAEMVGFFINDAREQIQIIERAVLAWEKGERTTEQLWAAQRGFHTLKGAGNSIGLTAVAQSVHEVEEHLEGLTVAGAVGDKPLFAFLLGAVDQLRRYLADLTRSAVAPWRHDWSAALALLRPSAGIQAAALDAQAATLNPLAAAAAAVAQSATIAETPDAASAGDEDSHYLRIEAARLYQLMNLIGEMVIDRARLARKFEQLTGWQRALAERNGALAAAVQNFQAEFEFNLGAKTQGPVAKAPALETLNATPGTRNVELNSEFSELEFDRYDQFNVLARSLVEISHDIEQLNGEVAACVESFAAENAQFAQTSQELQRRVTGLSLVPVKSLFPRLQRAFRDALTVEQKEAELVLSGGEALLDKVVVDKVYGPLLHLVRNAVAHGIEDPAARTQAKKSPRGEVRLAASQLANQIVLQLSDDGAGINAVAVRERAVAKGWLAADAPALAPEQVVHFIFQPGFSTASKVTSVSGRGVGLDVVRTEVENLNGSVELRYEPGQGSTWSLRLPLTLAISEAILARLGGVTYAFPLNFIEYGVVLDAECLVRAADGSETYVMQAAAVAEPDGPEAAPAQGLVANSDTSHFARDAVVGTSLPVVRLSRLLGVAGAADSNKGLIVGAGERRAVLVVDEVLARQEVVIKELDSVLAQHPLLNGASLDAEGRVIPILNVPGLLKLAAEQGPKACVRPEAAGVDAALPAASPSRPTRALVVDDSLSVRKVQERFLRELGCQVVLAKDGLEALERLRQAALEQAAGPGGNGGLTFDVVFTDLEMPRLNGFELITEVRGNPAWAAMPLVVISSRGADKYITKAMNLGASTFLSKPFTQEQLGEVLRHFVGAGRPG